MNSWNVTVGIFNAVLILTVIGMIANWHWLWQPIHLFTIIVGGVLISGLILVIILKVEELRTRGKPDVKN